MVRALEEKLKHAEAAKEGYIELKVEERLKAAQEATKEHEATMRERLEEARRQTATAQYAALSARPRA